MKLIAGTVLKCPHCGKYPDGEPAIVDYFTVKDKRTTNECGYCDGAFVVQEEDGTYQVTKSE